MYYLKQKFAVFVAGVIISCVYANKAANSPGNEMVTMPATITHKMILPEGQTSAKLVLIYQVDNGERGSMDTDNVSYATKQVGDRIGVRKTAMEWSHNEEQQSHNASMIGIAMLAGMISFFVLCSMFII